MTKSSVWFPIRQVLLTLLVCRALCAQPVRPQGNLLANWGFEEQDAAARPRAWAFGTHKGSPKALSVADAGRDGRRCVGVEAEGAGHTGLWTQDVPPAPGAPLYRLAAWIKTSPGATATLSASFYSKENKWLAANYGVVEATGVSQWRKCAGYFRIAPETASIKIALWGNYGSRGHGTVWFDDVELTTVKEMPDTPAGAPPAIRYLSPNPPPTPTAADTARGYVPFARNYLDLIPPTYAPSQDEVGEVKRVRELPILAAFCSLGEYEPLSLGLYALRDLKNVHAVVSDLKAPSGATIPSSAVDVRTVRYLYKRSHYSMGDRMLVPTHLEKKPLAEVPKGQSRQFWLTVHVPSNAAPGDYRGSVTIQADGAPDLTLPLKLEVLPIRLAVPKGIGFGMYDWPPRAEGDPSSEARFRDQRAHGMTTVGLCSGLNGKFDMADGRGRVTFD
ncbi:MAG: hypothetical protein FJ272_22360, partial [Planctomycetes bacterium]|nr:hypothetical protein [Planctomycetota bacterium]